MIMRMIIPVTSMMMCIAAGMCIILTTVTTAIIRLQIIALSTLMAEGGLWIAGPMRPA